MFAKIQRVHFIGIGGIGMSGIAEVLLNMGFPISGSDLKKTAITDRLEGLGAKIFVGHQPQNIQGAEVVVTSSAIGLDNPEVVEARSRHIALIQRAEMLSELMRLKYGIAIAGMHGKTTTTSMVASVLAAGGLDPTVVVGGRVDAFGSNARVGKSKYLVAEADESDRSFLKLSPIIAAVTNIDREHMDTYRDMEDVEQTFVDFLDRLPFYGMAVLCNDDERLRELATRVTRRVVTYGQREDSDFCIRLSQTALHQGEPTLAHSFTVEYKGKSLSEFQLFVPGLHNVLNATAAIAIGTGLDIPAEDIRTALEGFRGVDRRFQAKGQADGVSVVDDYGHHPTEIRATLAAARESGFKRVHVIFQPHRFTRTRDLMAEFSSAFEQADSLIVLDIYSASEQPIPGISGETLVKNINSAGSRAEYAATFEEAVARACEIAQHGDLILTTGAGNISQIAPLLLEALNSRNSGGSVGDGTTARKRM